jgi:hypothetical protein
MRRQRSLAWIIVLAVALPAAAARAQAPAEPDLLPPQLTKEQREHLLGFLQKHRKPDSFVPRDAKVIGPQGSGVELKPDAAPAKAVKQYMVQITPHRPVPGQEQPQRVDVYYYRPNPEAGKPGITVKHTVDLTTGQQLGATEVLLNQHTPISRDELAEAVQLAQDKSPVVRDLYKDRDSKAVRWEYLQLMIRRKHDQFEPGDRAVRLVFAASPVEGQAAPTPVRVLVNLTKGVVAKEE